MGRRLSVHTSYPQSKLLPSLTSGGDLTLAMVAWLQSYVGLHRANGYGTLLLIPAGVASGWVVARRAFGGKPVTQGLFYILGLLILVTGALGISKISDTRQHRKWMLRESIPRNEKHSLLFMDVQFLGMASLLGVIISARIIMLAARAIISDIGTFYEVSVQELLSVEPGHYADP